MYRGYIRLWRRIDENPIATKPAYLSVWLFIVRHSNHKNKQIIWNNEKKMIERGSFITSADKISQGTGVPRGTVERIIKYLKNEVMIEEQTTRRFRLIKVINYNDYQNSEEVNEEQMRNKRGTSEEQVDTTNNYKELKRIKKNDISSEQSSQVKEIMNIFYKINPTLNWGNTTDRNACLDLIKKFGFEETKMMAEGAAAVFGKAYAPRISKPYQLKNKLADLKAYFDSERAKGQKLTIDKIS